MRHTLFLGLAAATLLLGSGCCHSFRSFVFSPFGPGTLCDTDHCGGCGDCGGCGEYDESATCGDECGCGIVGRRHVVMAESDCGSSCDGCDRHGYPTGPLTWVFEVFNPRCWDGGCGERYWGDFHGDPPDLCDPCDQAGNWTGGSCSDCGMAGGSCSDCGTTSGRSCPNCGATNGSVVNERIVSPETEDSMTPTKAAPSAKSAQPEPVEDPYALRRVPTRARR